MYNPARYHRRSIRLRNYDYSRAGAYFVTIVTHGRECLFGKIAGKNMLLNHAGSMVRDTWLSLPQRFPGVYVDTFVIMPNHVHGIIVIGSPIIPTMATSPVGAPLVGALPGNHTYAKTQENPSINTKPPYVVMQNPRADLQNPAMDLQNPTMNLKNPAVHTNNPPTDIPKTFGDIQNPPLDIQPSVDPRIAAHNPFVTPMNTTHPPSDPTFVGKMWLPVDQGAPTRGAPTVGVIIGAFKSISTLRYIRGIGHDAWPAFNKRLWQRNYHERIIRDDRSLNRIRQYILHNPENWSNDRRNKPG